MKKLLIGILAFVLFINGIFWGWVSFKKKFEISGNSGETISTPVPTPKELLNFTFENLAKRNFLGSKIKIERELEEFDGKKHKAYLFSFFADGKRVTGQMNIPITERSEKMPVVILIRGYVDREVYRTGTGTNKAAGVFAENGYITLAPDFLGYGESEMPKNDVWWERFFNPVVVLELLASIKNIEQADLNNVFIWAHSNGGQIALSVLEITGAKIPTVLWAPVTKPFPYSVLYFTDEFDDEGKALRAEVARLEADYDVDLFSITKYLKRISAPIQLHQGTVDDAVPVAWSDEFVTKMKELEKDIEYFKYKEAGHNMEGSWDKVIKKDLEFFKKKMK